MTTPSRDVGYHISWITLRSGARPLLPIHRSNRLESKLLEHAEAVAAHTRDAAQLVTAAGRADTVYWKFTPPDTEDSLPDHARATTALVTGRRKTENPRVKLKSIAGAEKRHGAGEIDGPTAAESGLGALGIDLTHLRCACFLSSTQSSRRTPFGPAGCKRRSRCNHGSGQRQDIGEVAATTLLNPGWRSNCV